MTPEGTLVASRVVESLATPLETCFADQLTGYLRIESGMPLADADPVVVTLDGGVPTAAVVPDGDQTGAGALAALPDTGPFRVERARTSASALASLHDRPACHVDPGAIAERADAPALAARLRERAPDDPTDDSVADFLDDPDQIAALKAEARAEATARADEWGLSDQLDTE
ncbi:hypothetical protein DM867_02025 [Halosegnis rubeus]|jgi:hypothetical protein|uniref:DUF8054 domain-containing protein n=1 Tax=Halosegnis rubeus TaxID=2212850 RepID=A0A5N5UES0_9EURY|nr:hypothetical protein [Halosegnis rubeus]KAB7515942.1 hypothetical protein DM867_02025 [Halosegnis rubeus]